MEHVYVIVYNDQEDGSVNLDVFKEFEDALDAFDKTLRDVRNMHPSRPDWIQNLQRFPTIQVLYFITVEGYEVFLRKEKIQ